MRTHSLRSVKIFVSGGGQGGGGGGRLLLEPSCCSLIQPGPK